MEPSEVDWGRVAKLLRRSYSRGIALPDYQYLHAALHADPEQYKRVEDQLRKPKGVEPCQST